MDVVVARRRDSYKGRMHETFEPLAVACRLSEDLSPEVNGEALPGSG